MKQLRAVTMLFTQHLHFPLKNQRMRMFLLDLLWKVPLQLSKQLTNTRLKELLSLQVSLPLCVKKKKIKKSFTTKMIGLMLLQQTPTKKVKLLQKRQPGIIFKDSQKARNLSS